MVSIADDRVGTTTVVADLRAAGLVVDAVLDVLGVVTGSVAPEAIDALRTVPGVTGVERQRGVGVPPPGNPIA